MAVFPKKWQLDLSFYKFVTQNLSSFNCLVTLENDVFSEVFWYVSNSYTQMHSKTSEAGGGGIKSTPRLCRWPLRLIKSGQLCRWCLTIKHQFINHKKHQIKWHLKNVPRFCYLRQSYLPDATKSWQSFFVLTKICQFYLTEESVPNDPMALSHLHS